MNRTKWIQKLAIALAVIVFLPLIVVGVAAAGAAALLRRQRFKREYVKSRYYRDLGQRFAPWMQDSPEYRFYNAAMRRGLPVQYVRQESNGLEYFIYRGTIYLFPDFDQVGFDEGKGDWQADYDGEWKSFAECYAGLQNKLETAPEHPVKLLVERSMFPVMNLNDWEVPACIFVTWSYENAFENEDSPLKMLIPQNTGELYEMMRQTPELCGRFELDGNGKKIRWDLYKGIRIELTADPGDCCAAVSRVLPGGRARGLTHWHPSHFEIYDTVCRMGKRGNVMVLRCGIVGGAMLYAGAGEDCPYAPGKKYLLGRYYYLQAA